VTRAALIRRLLTLAGTVALAALLVYVWPQRLGGAATVVVVHGRSMEPTYHEGDVVIVRRADAYRAGDIAAYALPAGVAGAGHLVIHRIARVNDDGTVTFKGDSRATEDAYRVRPRDLMGRAEAHIPRGARLLTVLSSPPVLGLIAGVVVTRRLWPHEPNVPTPTT
jgi:signal peptidase